MYFTSLPDHTKPGFNEHLHFSKFRKHNIVFNALSGKSYCERHTGCLSVKTVLSGCEWYGIDKRQVAVRPGQFLVLNDNQEYSSRIDADENTHVLSVFFSNEFAGSVFHDTLGKEETLLDNPFETESRLPEFFQTLNELDLSLQQSLQALIKALNAFGYHAGMVEEHLLFLLQGLIRVHRTAVNHSNKVNAIKVATRTEIYKRLCVAKDFLHSGFMDKPNLSVLSVAACLSKPQLIRQFKAVFQTTPHQYLTRIKLAHAAGLLKQTSKPVNEIGWICGFEDTSAFCRAFRIQYGASPLHYRTMA